MPCEYVSVAIRERERGREEEVARLASEERKRKEIAKKKQTILKTLAAMGWSLDGVPATNDKNQTLILASKD